MSYTDVLDSYSPFRSLEWLAFGDEPHSPTSSRSLRSDFSLLHLEPPKKEKLVPNLPPTKLGFSTTHHMSERSVIHMTI